MTRWRRAAAYAALGMVIGTVVRDLGLHQAVSYHGERAALVAGAAAVGALLGLTRARVLIAGLAALLVALWLAVALTPLSRALASGLVRRDGLIAGDAVFVLGSDVQADGELSTQAMARLWHGLTLVRGGHAPRLIVSEIAGRPSHAAAVRKALADLRLDVELLVVGPVKNTHDEALAVAKLCGERGFGRVILATSPLHSRRAAETFGRTGLDVVSSPAPETEYDVERLSWMDDRLEAFGSVVHERIGLWVYRWRGWI